MYYQVHAEPLLDAATTSAGSRDIEILLSSVPHGNASVYYEYALATYQLRIN